MWSAKRSKSEREREPREWRFYVDDMIGFCERVRDYTAGLDQAVFISSPMPYDATLRNLELIDDAAMRIPESVRDAHPEIPWQTIIGTRNRLSHEYLRIDNDVVWDIVCNDVPVLLPALRDLLKTTGRD
ncbi:MAG: DUF86 domain-containing protein [Rhodospirillales bacterium]|nr:DUF86 domain-containing protein [Rhodospirillales bacterium]